MKRVVGRVVRADERSLCVEAPGFPAHRAGQFAMLQLDPTGTRLDPLLPRPMAIYRRDAERLEFRFKVVGRGTRSLARLSPGEPLGLVGPLGNGFATLRGPAVLVGGGTGIASLYELARQAARPARGPARATARVLLGGRSRDDVLGLPDFERLDVSLRVATEDGSHGHRGRVTELLEVEPGCTVIACGPDAMLRAVVERARAVGAACQVSLESPMACGFGICLGCAVRAHDGFRYVCTDGPVFDAAELDWGRSA